MFHKDMLTKTTDDKPEEVARASQESEMLVAAARSEQVAPPPPRARFADLDTRREVFLEQDEPRVDDSAEDGFWGEVRRRIDINWGGIGR